MSTTIFDVIIVGGSFAGLSAALYLARARRNVLVLDSGEPRNRYSSHSHGVFALDGLPGSELLELGAITTFEISYRNSLAQESHSCFKGRSSLSS